MLRNQLSATLTKLNREEKKEIKVKMERLMLGKKS